VERKNKEDGFIDRQNIAGIKVMEEILLLMRYILIQEEGKSSTVLLSTLKVIINYRM
jgi:hypothetical protein